MIRFVLRVLIAALGLWVASRIVPGARVSSAGAAVVAALALGVVNALVRPIVTLLTLPITVITLGLFLLVVNGLMILFVGWILRHLGVSGFHIDGLVPAILTTIVVWFISLAANMLLGDELKRR
ncbi:MAG: phage holin family protein [Caulobacteraceae bacterium]|nr:phage holin family protein [Caulobacteraceae bacterium]